MSDPLQVDLLIVGAGPVGLYAAYYAGFRGLETAVVESLPLVGGQVAAFYPEATLYDVPGFPAVRGDELVRRLADQARTFPVAFHLGETVHAIAADGDELRVASRTAAGIAGGGELREYSAKAVLIATGIGSFAPQRIKDPAVARFEGRGLAYDAADEDLRGKRVLVLGGTSRAVDVAVGAAAVAREVALLHRRDRLPDPGAGNRLAAAGIRFLPFSDLLVLEGSGAVERAIVADRRSGARLELAVDAVLPCYGFAADAEPLRRLGVALEGDAAVVDPRMATSRARIHAAGDGVSYPGKVRVLAAGLGEACTAVNNLAPTLLPGANVFPGYSSHRKGAAQRPSPAPAPRPGSHGPGRVLSSTPMTEAEIRERIEAHIAGAVAEVRDYTGTGDHFEVRVVADAFEGRSLVERHQMIYAALGSDVDGRTIHALSLKTLTKAQAARGPAA